jgi:hypothetical protein
VKLLFSLIRRFALFAEVVSLNPQKRKRTAEDVNPFETRIACNIKEKERKNNYQKLFLVFQLIYTEFFIDRQSYNIVFPFEHLACSVSITNKSFRFNSKRILQQIINSSLFPSYNLFTYAWLKDKFVKVFNHNAR